jgi:hypothetical protein
MSSVSGSEDEKHEGQLRERQGVELATRMLTIQSKRFYLDVKQNDRGRFIKFAEVSGGGKKSRIFMSMVASVQLRDHLQKFIDVQADAGKPSDTPEPALIHSETITNEKRRYFLDLRENTRGRFLRITQTFSPTGPRYSIAVPAPGIGELQSNLTELLNEFSEGYLTEPAAVELPETRSMRADNGKTFYFDPGHNDRGDFLRITEVKLSNGIRSSITLSMRNLPHFRDILNDICDKMQELRKSAGATAENADNKKATSEA